MAGRIECKLWFDLIHELTNCYKKSTANSKMLNIEFQEGITFLTIEGAKPGDIKQRLDALYDD